LDREVLQERDLFFREWPHLVTAAGDHAEQHPVFAQRQYKIGAQTALGGCARVRLVDQAIIGNVDKGGPGEQRRKNRGLVNADPAAQLLGPVLRDALCRDTAEGLAVKQIQGAARRAAVRARLFQYRLEDRLELTGRGIDDLQYLGGGGLLLQ
jgi:hypothetical protein